MNITFSTALLAMFASSAAAQTFIVDANGGSGTNFSDLPAAIATVPDGATLLVRPGTYSFFDIDNKSLTMLADPGAVAFGLLAGRVRNLSSSQSVTVRGLTLRGASTTGRLTCEDCDGTILIDSCDGYDVFGGSVAFYNCRDGRVTGCTFEPVTGPCVTSHHSDVRMSDCELVSGFFTPAVDSYDSQFELSSVAVTAGGWLGTGSIHLAQGTLRVLGNAPITSGGFGQDEVLQGIGEVRIDPSVPLVTTANPAIAASLQVTHELAPWVSAATGPAGGTATATLTGPAGIGALWLGLPGAIQPVAPFADPILIQAGSESLLALGSLPTALAATYSVPPGPLLRGLRVTWQGASIDAVSGAQISNAFTYIHY